MKFFIGVLALTVIGAIFVMPVVLLLGLHPLTASDRQSLEEGSRQAVPYREGTRKAGEGRDGSQLADGRDLM